VNAGKKTDIPITCEPSVGDNDVDEEREEDEMTRTGGKRVF
jgi:hypothetical protein